MVIETSGRLEASSASNGIVLAKPPSTSHVVAQIATARHQPQFQESAQLIIKFEVGKAQQQVDGDDLGP